MSEKPLLEELTWPIAVYNVDPSASELVLVLFNETRNSLLFSPRAVPIHGNKVTVHFLHDMQPQPNTTIQPGDKLVLSARMIWNIADEISDQECELTNVQLDEHQIRQISFASPQECKKTPILPTLFRGAFSIQ